MNLFRSKPKDIYFSDMHLYVDDLRELQDLRNKAYNNGAKGEGEFYDRLIEGAQKVLEFLQQETTHGR